MPLYLNDLDAWFVHVPKTGGTWHHRVFQELGLWVTWVDSAIKRSEHPVPTSLPGFNRDRAFGFVRYPSSWYLSWFRFRFGMWGKLDFNPVPELLACIDDCGAETARRFAIKVMKQQPALVTRLYEWMLGPVGWENVKWVGRQENLVLDTCSILRSLGLKDDDLESKLVKIKPENASLNPMGLQERYKQRIVEAERPCVLRWYGGMEDEQSARRYAADVGPWVRTLREE